MLAASHALIGAVVAQAVPNPWLAYPLAVLSHFLADLFPHWDSHTRHIDRTKLAIIMISLTDSLIGFILGWQLFHQTVNQYYLLSLMFVSQLPDWFEAPYHVFDWHFPPFNTVKKLQSRLHHKLAWPWGFILQIIAVGIIVVLVKL